MFQSPVSHFAASGPVDEGDLEGFVGLVKGNNDDVAVMQRDDFVPPDGLRCIRRATGFQMVFEAFRTSRPSTSQPLRVLGQNDLADVLNLVKLTEPGPFRPQTGDLGTYLGVRHGGQLIAMAGERLKPPGFTEISAVCVHPDHRVKGLAKELVAALIDLILSRGEVPFLHLYSDNYAALALYETLGFRMRVPVHIVMMRDASLSVSLSKERDEKLSSHYLGDPND